MLWCSELFCHVYDLDLELKIEIYLEMDNVPKQVEAEKAICRSYNHINTIMTYIKSNININTALCVGQWVALSNQDIKVLDLHGFH